MATKTKVGKTRPRFLIFDGNSIVHRAYHALPPTLTGPDGMLVNAAFGFTSIMLKAIADLKPTYVVVAWDYPADTRGYTWGVALEWIRNDWALRVGSLMEPREANQLELDHDVRHAHGEVIELEHDHELGGQKGALRLLAFQNHARMGSYREALDLAPAAPDVTATRLPGRAKHGFGLNAEQAITPDLGLFLRAGWNDGKTESWAFTEVERTLSMGLSAGGRAWGRNADRVGLGFAVNGLNRDHRDYLAAGGYGFMVGDGRLAYAAERVVDAYYALALGARGSFSLEAQRFEHLAFNRDRGPATIVGLRLHLQL